VKRLLAAVLASLLVSPSFAPVASAQGTEADVYVGQAIVDFHEQRYDAALDNLRRALEIEPDHVEALYYTGVVRLAQRRPADAVPLLERARAKSPTDRAIAFQLGLAHFAAQQYDRAEPILEDLFRAEPTVDGLGYYVGFMRYRKKDYRGALDAFRAGRASDPEIQQLAGVYTALALAALGLPARAAAEVEQALRLAPSSPITGPTERLRDAIIAARQAERRLSGEVRVGMFFDDNVRVLPSAVGRTDPAADPAVSVLRQQSRKSRDSVGELLGVRAEYTWLKTEAWESSVGYSFFLSYYNDVPSFNITDHLATASVVHRTTVADLPVQVGAQYAFDALFLDDDEFVRRNTASVFGVVSESDMHLTQVIGRIQNKEFNETQPIVREESRDADNLMAGVQHFLRFAEDRHFLKLGYQFDWDHTEGRNYEYRGHRLLAGGQYTLPWRAIRLKYDFDLHLRGYVFPNSLLPSNDPGHRQRYDKEATHVFRVEVPLPYDLTLSAEYLKTINVSNLEVFDYNRNVTSLILSWTF
jgi:tetratricopeptide (TPR) repeat protein